VILDGGYTGQGWTRVEVVFMVKSLEVVEVESAEVSTETREPLGVLPRVTIDAPPVTLTSVESGAV
jgi:hypothetical protein